MVVYRMWWENRGEAAIPRESCYEVAVVLWDRGRPVDPLDFFEACGEPQGDPTAEWRDPSPPAGQIGFFLDSGEMLAESDEQNNLSEPVEILPEPPPR
ncbi:MAG: hypothetical protein FJ125_00995 [Deltaproteobacteria bacterium]|nr:hypothetical protein [Deltaproteobacteria bacterium]